MNSRDRYGTVSHRSRRLPKNSTIRPGASRIDRALRDGGVSTMTRSKSPRACRSWSCSIARYSWLWTKRLVMFSYSGLASTASRVLASGAWRVISSSQPAFVSSMATHTSPRTLTPAALNAAGSMRTGVLPNSSSPSAVARRRAGSTVSTSTRDFWRCAAAMPSAAAIVVLPTPPRAGDEHHLAARRGGCRAQPRRTATAGRARRRDRVRRPAPRRRAPRRGARPHARTARARS